MTDKAERVLPIIVIYANPLDHPGKYVTRRQWARRGGTVEAELEPLAVVDTLAAARAAVPPECDTRLDRDPADEPQIVECWI